MVPADHPLRRIRTIVDAVLAEMDGDFEAMYSSIGRPSVPPETLLKSTVLMALFSIRSERAFCQHLTYNLLFKWFLDLHDRRPGVRPHHLHQEPGAAAPGRDRRPLPGRGRQAGQAAALHLQ